VEHRGERREARGERREARGERREARGERREARGERREARSERSSEITSVIVISGRATGDAATEAMALLAERSHLLIYV